MKEKGIEKDKSHKLVSFFSIALVFLTTIFLPRLAFAKEELCSFSTKVEKKKSRGCADMDVEIVEIKREPITSVVQVKVKKRGSYSGAIIFQNCCFANIAKARGYRYFVKTNNKVLKDCKECEWNEEYTLVFLKSKSDSISSKYKKLLPKKKEYKIEDINESSKLCGFLPMSSSEFHQAVYYGELEKVRELSKNNKSLINAKDENGYQPLHIATVEGYPEIVRFLISCGADINGKTKSDEWAPLHLAVRFYKINIVKLLLKKS